jgi:hypothetical protein
MVGAFPKEGAIWRASLCVEISLLEMRRDLYAYL